MYIVLKRGSVSRNNSKYYFYICKSYREGNKVKRRDKYLCALTLKEIFNKNYYNKIDKLNMCQVELLENKLEDIRVYWDMQKYFMITFGKINKINLVI